MDVLIWGILAVVFIILEVATVQLVSVWFAAGAFITMFVAYFTDIGVTGQLGIFLLTSALFLVLWLPAMKKRMEKKHIATNAELDIGKSAVVIEEINKDLGTGRVTLSGVNWSAFSEDGSIIPKDAIVTVTAVKGAKLEVKPKINDKE